MINIKYVVGDATDPQGDGKKFIIHVCNSIGGWGRGFVMALSKKWKEPEQKYREWAKSKDGSFTLGSIQAVGITKEIAVINMIAQEGVKPAPDGTPPIRYESFRECLKDVYVFCKKYQASVHAPYLMGAGLAGGDWDKIEKIIIEELSSKDISVTLYDINNIRKV